MLWLLILSLGVAAGTVGGVVGFGSAAILAPALVLAFGPIETVPILAIASVIANLSRVLLWWREIDWRVNAAYCAPAIPAAALGASIVVNLDPRLIEGALGIFLIALIPGTRWLAGQNLRLGLADMAMVGAGVGFLSGLVASTGPVNTPFFLAYGLTKGAFLATEALGSAAVSFTKAIVFQSFGIVSLGTLLRGLTIGCALLLGTWLAKSLVARMDPAQFRALVEVLVLLAGSAMVWSALTRTV